jgi:putative peptidoglycan lipid II flippase
VQGPPPDFQPSGPPPGYLYDQASQPPFPPAPPPGGIAPSFQPAGPFQAAAPHYDAPPFPDAPPPPRQAAPPRHDAPPFSDAPPPPRHDAPPPSFQPGPPFPDALPPGTPPWQSVDAAAPPQPTFTPHEPGERGRSRRRSQRESRPRPTFTPREGYLPPAAYEPPPPPGYTTQAFPQPFGYPSAPPRFIPRRDIPEDERAPGAGDGRTSVLEAPDDAARTTGPERRADTSPNLARSSKAMAFGTLASRGTGFLRTFVFLVALGVGGLSEAYNNSNTLPNTVYYLMLGGIFTSVVVPLLVRAAKEDPDRGEGYAERIFTIGVVALLLITVIATMLASPLVDLYAGNITDKAEHHVMVIFAYFFIPQIFFYGMDSLLGAILNVRGRFGANMWTPVINNVVVIAIGVAFILTQGLHRTPHNVSSGGIRLLAIGTTLGIVIQSIALFPVLRRAGFSFRLRFGWRRSEIGEIGRMAGWMLFYVATQWVGNLIVQRVCNAASNTAQHHGDIQGVGYPVYANAWQLFQLPYAVVGISVISALLPRMSGHATDRRYSLVRDDFSKGVRIASVIVMPAAVFLAVLGPALCEMLFAYGSTNASNAHYIGLVFGVFSLGLVPFMLTQLQLRVFYSFHENRTPALIGFAMLLVGVIGDLVALYTLPATHTVLGLAFAYDLVTLTGAILAWPLLLRRVGSLDGWRITRSLVRMLLATLPGLVFAFVVMMVVGSFLHAGPLYGLVVTLIGGGGALLLYAVCCRLLGIEEFRTLMRTVGGRFG